MNILFCLTPKSEVDYITQEATLFKTLQKMQAHNYDSIPIIDKKGKYKGTITAGDLLGCIKENFDLSVKASADFPLKNVKRTKNYKAVNGSARMEEILGVAINQNFVPVVDDEDNFIGIIKRGDILAWLKKKYSDYIDNDTETD